MIKLILRYLQFAEILIFALLLAHEVQAQEWLIFRDTGFRRLNDTWKSTGERNGSCKILRTLARYSFREPDQVMVRVPYSQMVSGIPAGNGITVLTFSIESGVPEGETMYRQFPVAAFMRPDVCELSFRWWSKRDSASTAVRVSRKAAIPDSGKVMLKIPVLHYDPVHDTILIDPVQFGFSDSAERVFDRHIRLISDYYASSAVIDTLLQAGRMVRLDPPALLPAALITVEEMNRMTRVIRSRNFPETLIRKGGDPSGVEERLTELNRMSLTLRFNFMDRLLSAGRISPACGSDSLAGLLIDRLMYYIALSRLVDGISGEIYSDFLHTFFTGNVFDDDLDVVEKLAIRMFPDAHRDTLMTYLSGTLLQAFTSRAEQLNTGSHFADALLLLSLAQDYIDSNPFIHRSEGTGKVMLRAAEGIYRSYLGIAAGGLRNGRLDLASAYLVKAEEFRGQHPDVHEDPEYGELQSMLLTDQFYACDRLVTSGKYLEAWSCLDSLEHSHDPKTLRFLMSDIRNRRITVRSGMLAEAVENTENLFREGKIGEASESYARVVRLAVTTPPEGRMRIRLDSLAGRMDYYRYREWIGSAERSYFGRDYDAAVSGFDSAQRIAQRTGIRTEPLTDSLYLLAVKKRLLEEIRQGQQLIWSNRIGDATSYKASMEERARELRLSGDPEVVRALESYERKKGGQACRVVADSFQILLIRASGVTTLGNFRKGIAIYRQILDLSESYPGCDLRIMPVKDSIRKYDRAAACQQSFAEAEMAVASGDYHIAADRLIAAEKAYRDFKLERFGLPPIDAYKYIASRQNPLLTERAVAVFYSRAQYRESFRYLKLMKTQGVQEKSVRSIQQQIGHQMALDDRRKGTDDPPGQKIREYTGNDTWFRSFTQAYLEACR